MVSSVGLYHLQQRSPAMPWSDRVVPGGSHLDPVDSDVVTGALQSPGYHVMLLLPAEPQVKGAHSSFIKEVLGLFSGCSAYVEIIKVGHGNNSTVRQGFICLIHLLLLIIII